MSLGFFWLLGLCVFYQFFTRYVLNDSAAWTEEIARYLLICTVFVGIAAAVRRTRHIHVDFLYRLIPARRGPRAVDGGRHRPRSLFFAIAVGLTIQMMMRMGSLQMTIIDLPMNLIYGVCAFGFAAAAVRSVQVAIENWRRGWSLLERPEHAIEETSNERQPGRPKALATSGETRAARSGGVMTGTLLTAFLALMVTGIPVAIAMAGASLIYIWLSGSSPPMVVVHRMISGLDSFPLLAVPFFILAGNLMNNAGITNRIYNFALALVGWMKGGLGHVNIIGSVIFAGMSGTAIADAAGLGTIEIKAMRDHGYSKEFSVGVTAASATLGPIIPPSLPFVIYGMVANVSIGQLFLAGILPGLVMTVLMMLTVAYFAHKNNWGADIKFMWSRVGKAMLELAIVIAFPLVIWAAVAARRQPVRSRPASRWCCCSPPTGNGSSRRCCRS